MEDATGSVKEAVIESVKETLMERLKEFSFDFVINNWQPILVTVVVILVIAMLFKPTRKFLFKVIEKSTGFQLGTFEDKAAEKTRRIIKEAKRQYDSITRCQGVLATMVAQAGCIIERGMIKSWKVREHLHPVQLKCTFTLLLL